MGRGLIFIVSGFIIIFGLVQMSLQNRQQGLRERSSVYFYEEQSRNIAATMMDVALARLNNNLSNPNAAETTMNLENLNGTGKIQVTVAGPAFLKTQVDLKIQGIIQHSGSKTVTTIIAEAKRTPFSRFSYFTDEEPTIWFVTGDTLTGPVHTNGEFHIDGDPVFNGLVTSADDPEVKSGSNPEFKKGHNWNADPIMFPTEIPDIAGKAENGGLRFDTKIKVEFNADRTAKITEYQQTGTNQECIDWDWDWDWGSGWDQYCSEYSYTPIYEALSPQIYDLSEYNGIISASGDVEVEGTLNGNLTLHSEGDIIVTGDVIYENTNFGDDEDDFEEDDDRPLSNDLLGLVSEDDVIVEKNAHEVHGNSDVIITASIMALESFTVEGYDDGEERGQLNVVGGIIQRRRGPVGLVSGSGYIKNYSYDVRLLESSTNGFPTVDRFEIESWRETTEEIPISN